MPDFAARRNRLRSLLAAAQADGLLVTSFINVTYLTGFTGDDSYLLVAAESETVLSDSRYEQQLEEECPGLPRNIRVSGQKMIDSVVSAVRDGAVRRLAVEAGSVTLALWRQLELALPHAELVAMEGCVEELRQYKDADEIAELREAIALAESSYEAIRRYLQAERTERQIAFELERVIREQGGQGCSFPPIVALGPRSALPHATPTQATVGESDFLLLDWGAVPRLYRSDLTRILVTGKISPKLEEVYGVVLEAQQCAINSIRPGVPRKSVDAAARDVIVAAGYGRHFGHGLGHGIGLEIHEAPRLASDQDQPLQPGMVVTVEPGIYLPGWGGVRLEDDVLVTADGCEILSSLPRTLAASVVG